MIFSLEVINFVLPNSIIFLWIAAYVADDAAVNPNGIKTLLVSGLSTFLIKGGPVFSNSLKCLLKNPPYCLILWILVFDTFIIADKPFAKALRSLETCQLVNNNLWGKLFESLESPTIFDENFQVNSVSISVYSFNLLSYGLHNFTFKVLYWVIVYWYYIKVK